MRYILLVTALLFLITIIHATNYTISPGDILDIITMGHSEFTVYNIYILPDGTFHFPGIGIVQGSGLNTQELAEALEEELSVYIVNPIVTVTIKHVQSQNVNIYGYVNRPGRYYMNDGTNLYSAFGYAGGIVNFRRARIFKIIRADYSVEIYQVKDFVCAEEIVKEVPRLYAGDTLYIREPCSMLTSEWTAILATIGTTILVINFFK